jgi:hypothetical protein
MGRLRRLRLRRLNCLLDFTGLEDAEALREVDVLGLEPLGEEQVRWAIKKRGQ